VERDRVLQQRDVAVKHIEELGNASVTTTTSEVQVALERLRQTFALESGDTSLPKTSAEVGTRLEREQSQLRSVGDNLKEKRGELNHVGGSVFRERQEREQETYDSLVKRAEDLESEYRAKKHLFDALKREEEKQSTHLGRILAGPVSATFAELTAERYSQLSLDPGLRFQSVAAMKGERPVEALSVGIRDQLATIVRLALAAHLRSVVVLDDQLTQSDARAMRWFRDRIRASVRDHGHQVVVVTCNAEDYLDPKEMPASGVPQWSQDAMVAAADLTDIVSRQ
jgi:chromosome segregation ATPase